MHTCNKDDQWLSSREADCEQNDIRLWKHYLPLRSVIISDLNSRAMRTQFRLSCLGIVPEFLPMGIEPSGNRHE